MTARPKLSGAGIVLAGLLGWTGAGAATICVEPSGAGGCRTTIQAAVDASGPGDLVLVHPGVYYEGVDVPPGKDGLRIAGLVRETTIIDSSPYFDRGFAGAEPSMRLLSSNVRLERLTFRNGSIGVEVEAPDAVLERLSFRGTDGAVMIRAPRAEVRACDFQGCLDCISIQSPDALVRNNVFEGAGTNISLEEFTLASGARILDNRISGGRNGIFTEYHETTVRNNDVRYQLVVGIKVQGDNPVVDNNTVVGTGYGILAYCQAPIFESRDAVCTRASVSRNTVMSSRVNGAVIGVSGPGVVARSNTIARSLTGLTIASELARILPVTAERNHVTRSGFVGEGSNDLPGHCIEVFAGGTHVARNRASLCVDSGFSINGPENVVEANEATHGAESGFTVRGGGFVPARDTTLTGNTALRNAGQGIAIREGAPRTIVTGNTALRNRVDFCDEGVQTVVSGNVFGTTGPCAIVH